MDVKNSARFLPFKIRGIGFAMSPQAFKQFVLKCRRVWAQVVASASQLLRLTAAFAILGASGLACAESWPTKPVRVIVPFTPGGPTDILARLVGQQLSQKFGQQFIIDNRSGAGGTVGTAEVARARPDGYTLLFTTSSTHAISPHLRKLPYNPVSDFTPIAHVADSPLVMLVPTSLGVKSVSEFIAMARANPGKLDYATSGAGTIPHLTTEAFLAQTNLNVVHVPYKGGAPALPDLMSGTVQLLFSAMPGVMDQVKGGRVRALAITSAQRSPLAPDLPTVAESGVPGFSSVAWFGLFGPKGMDPQLANRLHDEVINALQAPSFVSGLAMQGAEPGHGSQSEFATMVANDSAHWAKIIRDRKITLE